MKKKIAHMLYVFNGKQKIALVGLIIIMVMNAVLELLGVSAILPFINAILQPEILWENQYIKPIIKLAHIDNNNRLIITIGIIIIFVYVIKNVMLIYMTNLQYKFSYYGTRDLGNRFMKYYLSKEYSFFFNHNTAELMRDISSDVDMFYATVLAFLQLISETTVCLALVILLFTTDFFITIGASSALGLMVFFFMGNYKNILIDLGEQRRLYSYKKTKSMQEGFGGIKEIKVANRERYFEERFEDANNKNAEANRRNLFLNAIPKPVMEVLCIGGLMTVICIKIYTGVDSKKFISVLGVFAVAAFRLLPSVNKLSGYIGNMMHNGVVIDEVYDKVVEMQKQEKLGNKSYLKADFKNKILIENVSFRYPETEYNVLEKVKFEIYKNQSAAFVGPSGAGKTTLADIILGLIKPTEGSILVDGNDIFDNINGWREILAYIPQNIYMLDDTIRNNITFGMDEHLWNDERVWEALEEAQLKEFVQGLPEGLDTMIGEAGIKISGGQRQRIGIARALFRRPKVLVLDEATSALDNDTEAAVMESIEKLQGKLTMIIIAHRLTTIKNCDVIYEIKDRKANIKNRDELGI